MAGVVVARMTKYGSYSRYRLKRKPAEFKTSNRNVVFIGRIIAKKIINSFRHRVPKTATLLT